MLHRVNFFAIALLLVSVPRITAAPLYALCGAYPPEIKAITAEFDISEANGWARSVIKGLVFWQGKAEGKDVLFFRTGVSPVNAA